MGDSADARQMWWEGLPRWERELRMLAAFWPPEPVLPRPEGRLRHHGPRDPGPPPSYIHPSVAKRYLRPTFGRSLGGFTREGSSDKFFNSYTVVLPEEKTSAKRRGKRVAGQDFSMVLGLSDSGRAPDGRREFLDPFQYHSPDELLQRVVQEVDEHLAPLSQTPDDQLLRTFIREYVKRNAGFPGTTKQMAARLASRDAAWRKQRQRLHNARMLPVSPEQQAVLAQAYAEQPRLLSLEDCVSDDDARVFLEWVRIPPAFRRALRELDASSVAVPRVAGVLLYIVAAVGTFWWRLRALDEEGARRRREVGRDRKAFTSTRNRIEAEWGLPKKMLERIDRETAHLRGSLKLLTSGPKTRAMRWALRMYRDKPVRVWRCWTPAATWVMAQLSGAPAAATVARLLNGLTAHPLNAAVLNPFCSEPKVRWPFRPMWSRSRTGPALSADAIRQRYYRFHTKKRRAGANKEHTPQELRPAAD